MLEAHNLGFTVGGKSLLSDIQIAVPENTLCAVVGPSGAGKSTLLKLLCGIGRPSRGRILLAGKNASEQKGEGIGYVPQDDIVHRALTVGNVMRYAAELRLSHLTAEQRNEQVDRVLELLELDKRRGLRVHRLSGGQRKRVSIGVELLAEPRMLFLDEPTSGLDPGLERQLMHLLADLAHTGRTVLLTTHVMETMDVVDQLVVVYHGHLAYAGQPQEAQAFFRVDQLRHLFDKLKKRSPQAWASAFQRERRGQRAGDDVGA